MARHTCGRREVTPVENRGTSRAVPTRARRTAADFADENKGENKRLPRFSREWACISPPKCLLKSAQVSS